MKKLNFTFLLVFIAILGFGQAQRIVLLEHFTQASCGPCATYNPAAQELLDANPGKIVAIKYQTSWPGFDPMNEHNPTQVQARVNYYSVTGVPNSVIDGNYFNGSPANWGQSDIDYRYGIASPAEIALSYYISPNWDSIYITMTATAKSAISGNIKARIAVIENEIAWDVAPGSNGEKEFYSVMKKMLPTATGTDVPDLAVDETFTVTTNWKLENIYNETEIAVVAFIQDDGNKQVLQAAYSSVPLPQTFENEVLLNSLGGIGDLVCGTSVSPVINIKNRGSETLTNLKITYSVNEEEDNVYDWTGSVGFFENEEINLPAITFNMLDTNNVLNIKTSLPNGSVDEFDTNNSISKSFDKSLLANKTLIFNLKLDKYGTETSWALKNKAGSSLYSGGPYADDSYELITKTFNLTRSDCYELIVYDKYGDGLDAGYGNGYYVLTDANDKQIVRGAKFGKEESTPFEVITNGTPTLTFYPENGALDFPIDSNITVTFDQPVRMLNNDLITNFDDVVVFKIDSWTGRDVSFSASINDDNTVLTINPTRTLFENSSYFLKINAVLENFYDDAILADSIEFEAKEPIEDNITEIINNSLHAFPNPANSQINVTFKTVSPSNYSITAIDQIGREIFVSKSVENAFGNQSIQINTSDWAHGIFLLKIVINDNLYTKKLIINHNK